MVVFNLCSSSSSSSSPSVVAARPSSPPPSFLLLPSDRIVLFIAVVVYYVFVMVVVELPCASALNLTCYSCNTTDPSDVCYNNVSEATTARCPDDDPKMECSVFREDVAGKFTYMIRGCNSSCVQKCGAWGETVDIDKCTSCCKTDLCNIDDAASTPWTAATTWRRLWDFGA